MDLISKRTRRTFREHLVGWYARAIEDLFESADIALAPLPEDRDFGGVRRTLVEGYYADVDWSSPRDVRKVLSVYAEILSRAAEEGGTNERLLNALGADGYSYIDGRLTRRGPIDIFKIQDAAELADRAVLSEHLRRIEHGAESDPAQAIGSAKELVETAARLVLQRFGEEPGATDTVQQLVKRAMKCLNPGLEDLPSASRGAESIRQVVSGLGQVVGGVAELRNLYGTGHGRTEPGIRLESRHAHLVVGACGTLVLYLLETLEARTSAEQVATQRASS